MINKDKEIGGSHYSDMKIEPIELITALELDFTQGCIIKYISRYNSKNGIEDLKKALHYCDIANSDAIKHCFKSDDLVVKMYCIINNLGDLEKNAIYEAVSCDYNKCKIYIKELIDTKGVDNA